MNGARSSFLSVARLVQRVIRERWCPFALLSSGLPTSSPAASARATRCLRNHLSALEERLSALKRAKTVQVLGRQSRAINALAGALSRLLPRALHMSPNASSSANGNCSDAACFRRLVVAANCIHSAPADSPSSVAAAESGHRHQRRSPVSAAEKRLASRLRAAEELVRSLETLELSLTRTLLRIEEQVSLLRAIRSILLQSAAALHAAQAESSQSSNALTQARLDHIVLQHMWRWWTSSNRQ